RSTPFLVPASISSDTGPIFRDMPPSSRARWPTSPTSRASQKHCIEPCMSSESRCTTTKLMLERVQPDHDRRHEKRSHRAWRSRVSLDHDAGGLGEPDARAVTDLEVTQ